MIKSGQKEDDPNRAYCLYHGDCVETMKRIPDNSVDAIVCDPPYGLGFMGKSWDDMGSGIGKRSHSGQKCVDGENSRFWGVTYSASGNVRCVRCDKWRWSHDACKCEQPLWPNTNAAEGRAQYRWHLLWLEQAYRILKPGGHLIAFGGDRTYHRLAMAVEDTGFTIKFMVCWNYFNGFPKGTNIADQIDRQTTKDPKSGDLRFGRNQDEILAVTHWIAHYRDQAGITNAQIDKAFGFAGMAGHWTTQASQPSIPSWDQWVQLRELLQIPDSDERSSWLDNEVQRLNGRKGAPGEAWEAREVVGQHTTTAPGVTLRSGLGEQETTDEPGAITKPLTPEAQAWVGWNTALKPAHEPAVLAQKPISERTIAANVLKWGTGALNIDACRFRKGDPMWMGPYNVDTPTNHGGRDSGVGSGTGSEIYGARKGMDPHQTDGMKKGWWPSNNPQCKKVQRKEREAGMDGFEPKKRMAGLDDDKEWVGGHNAYLCGGAVARKNNHPTVKPIRMMSWFVRLVTPPGGVVLDPFMGSGSTGCSAMLEGFDFIGCEKYPLPEWHPDFDPDDNMDAFGISCARIKHWRKEALNRDWDSKFGSIFGWIGEPDE